MKISFKSQVFQSPLTAHTDLGDSQELVTLMSERNRSLTFGASYIDGDNAGCMQSNPGIKVDDEGDKLTVDERIIQYKNEIHANTKS